MKTKRYVMCIMAVVLVSGFVAIGARAANKTFESHSSAKAIAQTFVAVPNLDTIMKSGDLNTDSKQSKKDESKKDSDIEEKKADVVAESNQPNQLASNPIVYDNMTLEELSAKLNRSLNSTLSGYGNLFASYSLELGVDPYIAIAIVLEETGCTWECSQLVQQCNNVGGMVGSPSCGSGGYRAFPTLEAGIRSYVENLGRNYFAMGLTTPETINTKYATSTTWASKVNRYIEKIRAN